MTIAGFDPSGGAGVLADCKTFELNKVHGLGVTTSITYQNEDTFTGVDWLTPEQIIRQAELQLEKYRIDFVKIGLVQNLEVLDVLLSFLLQANPKMKIVWDPILKASAGFDFHTNLNHDLLQSIYERLFLITPNWKEIQLLFPETDPVEAAQNLAQYCMVYLKGGHNEQDLGRDYLFKLEKDGQVTQQPFKAKRLAEFAKHGSGCILSSALTANIAKGYPLTKACLKAKDYTLRVIESNKTLLGFHFN